MKLSVLFLLGYDWGPKHVAATLIFTQNFTDKTRLIENLSLHEIQIFLPNLEQNSDKFYWSSDYIF